MNDDAGTGRWMTYDELAAVRGIKRIAAVRLVQRYKWRRQAGNDGRARVLVPHDALGKVRGSDAGIGAPPLVTPTDAGNGAGSDAATMQGRSLAALEDAIAALREAQEGEIATLRDMVGGLRDTVARAEHRAVHAEQRAAEADARVEQAKAQLADLDAKVARLNEAEADAKRANAETQDARQAAEALNTTIYELKAGQAMMQDMHTQELAVAQREAQEAAEALRQAEAARQARGRLRRAWDGWRGR